LDKASLPRYMDRRRLEILHARAVNAAGGTANAYGDLIKAFTSTPTDEVRAALTDYGKKLGKDFQQVEKDIWAIRSANARAATPFSLVNYSTRKPMSLTDFRGRVFLLNFWYPQCGPCRGEFPYIQSVLDKYKSQGFEIVAVNVHPPEDDFVLPLLKGFKLGFIPLKSDDKWAAEAYKVRGYPTNFLIGADGRIFFGPINPISSPEAQRTLELQVEALLLQAKSMNREGHP
jgi:thiol-disulfide isomerase/thioredoxin